MLVMPTFSERAGASGIFREAHEKLSPTNTGVMLGQRLQLFVIHPIDVISAHALRAGELLLLAHGRRGDRLPFSSDGIPR